MVEASSESFRLKKATLDALRLMRDAGFKISGNVQVTVDPDLPFMGYSTQKAGGNIVVVAGKAVASGMIEGLLIHEMCHIYRTEQKHPSHNHELLERVGLRLIHHHRLAEDYQVKLVQQAVNHVQDLYADDISFRIFQKSQIFTPEQAFEFFQDWVDDTPIKSKTAKTRWLNVDIMLNNCFAISNLTRHKVPDINNQAENKIQEFLSQTDDEMRKEFSYFQDFMTNLREDATEQQFEEDLTEYLTRTVRLAKAESP